MKATVPLWIFCAGEAMRPIHRSRKKSRRFSVRMAAGCAASSAGALWAKVTCSAANCSPEVGCLGCCRRCRHAHWRATLTCCTVRLAAQSLRSCQRPDSRQTRSVAVEPLLHLTFTCLRACMSQRLVESVKGFFSA